MTLFFALFNSDYPAFEERTTDYEVASFADVEAAKQETVDGILSCEGIKNSDDIAVVPELLKQVLPQVRKMKDCDRPCVWTVDVHENAWKRVEILGTAYNFLYRDDTGKLLWF